MDERSASALQAQISVLAAAVFALVKTHPRPAMFRAEFVIVGEQAIDDLLQRRVEDADIELARKLHQRILGALPKTGDERA